MLKTFEDAILQIDKSEVLKEAAKSQSAKGNTLEAEFFLREADKAAKLAEATLERAICTIH